MIDFLGSGYDAAERLDLLPDLERIHYPVKRLVFLDARGRERFALPYPLLRRRLFGGRHFNFLRGDLERVLYDRARESSPVRFGLTVESFQERPGHVRVLLSDGSTEEADLLVGADGVHSHVRRLAFGLHPEDERPLGFQTAAFFLESVPPHLPPSDDFVTLTVPDRQVAVYPIRGGRLAAFLLHRTGLRAPAQAQAPPRDELRAVYGDLGWVVPALLEGIPAGGGLYFDTVSQVELPRWSSGRVTLVGDACQCVSLLAGQGASLALAAAYVLAEELDRSATDVAQALARYEKRLRPWIAKKQATGRRIAQWFVPATAARLALRDFMVRASVWPFVAPFARRSLGAESLFRP